MYASTAYRDFWLGDMKGIQPVKSDMVLLSW